MPQRRSIKSMVNCLRVVQLPATPCPTIFFGSTISSNCFSSMHPDWIAASFKLRPSSCALWAIAAARQAALDLAYSHWKQCGTQEQSFSCAAH